MKKPQGLFLNRDMFFAIAPPARIAAHPATALFTVLSHARPLPRLKPPQPLNFYLVNYFAMIHSNPMAKTPTNKVMAAAIAASEIYNVLHIVYLLCKNFKLRCIREPNSHCIEFCAIQHPDVFAEVRLTIMPKEIFVIGV
jgi:hypothetical protein